MKKQRFLLKIVKHTTKHKKNALFFAKTIKKLKNIIELQKEIYSNSLLYFIERSFYIINQGTKFINNWHLEAIAEALTEIYKGNIKRLLINMPPRYLKSVCVSVAFPAWILGKDPTKRIIVASYSEKLSLKHSTDCRLIVNNNWFKNIFPECILSKTQNEKYKFSTTKNGYRFATSVGGTLTGEGGDILIIDDPHNPQQVLSNKYREKTLNWYDNTFSSRLNDKKNGAIIVVMQRLHENDLSGHLLKKGGWLHLNLPVIFEEDYILKIGNFSKKVKKGELLFEKREGLDEIKRIRQDMGSYVFNCQYQQKPLTENNGTFSKNWFRYYKDNINFEAIYLSFDTAIKAGINNDPTVCSVWGLYKNNYYIIDIYRDWLEYPDLKRKALQFAIKWKPKAILIEDKASGQSLIQDLKKDANYNIIAIKVIKDKITRFASITPIFEAGRVFLKDSSEWLFDFEQEILSFPNSEHDDQVDSISQFLNWFENNPIKKYYIRKL